MEEVFENRWMLILGLMLRFLVRFITSERAPNYTFLHEATTAPLTSYYDYIIVGGGTAGCPLAATLSQNASVLVLERGGSPYGNSDIMKMDGFWNNIFDTSPSSPSQIFLYNNGRRSSYRARVLGGGSSVNAGFYTRADAEFLREAGLDGDEDLLNESYQWVENKLVFKPTLKNWHSAIRDGLLEVGVLPDNGFTYDHVYGTKVGGVIYDKQGNRHSTADLLEYADPAGIKVLLHATVTKILFSTKGESRQLVASGIVFKDSLGNKHKAFLKKGSKNEIILSAGAIGSPQLLMLSGVGPAKHLNSHNIRVVLDQPFIGQEMGDNPESFIYVPSRIPIGLIFPQVAGITRYGNFIGALCGDLRNGKNEMDSNLGVIGAKILGPLTSNGHIELRNQNPDDNPLITFNYFNDPKELEKCVNGMKTIEKIMESKSLSKFKYENHSFFDLLNFTGSYYNIRPKHEKAWISLEQYCKDIAASIGHYYGGCRSGKVVDQDYKIMGLDSIRVIDGSTFLSSPGAFPQATLMMLGRYMGIKILRERSSNIVPKTEESWQNDALVAQVGTISI